MLQVLYPTMHLSLFCLTAALLAVAPAFGARNTGYQPRRKRAELARKPERDLQKKQPGKGKPKSIVLTTGGAPVVVDEVRRFGIDWKGWVGFR